MITSRSNPTIQKFRRLKSELPDDSRRVIIEGDWLFLEAVKAAVSFEALFFTSAALNRPRVKFFVEEIQSSVPVCETVSPKVLESLTLEETPPGIWGVVKMPADAPVTSAKCVVVLAGIQDPGNAGSLLRTAEGAGVSLWFSDDSVHRFHPKVVKVSMGSAFRVPARQGPVAPFLQKLKKEKWNIAGTRPSGGISYDRWEWKFPFALLLGSEARGVPPELERLADAEINIPLEGELESLNVGVAGAVLLFEARRRERESVHKTERFR